MTTRARSIPALQLAWLASGCAARYLPPPALPARLVPHIGYTARPPGPGEGQVTIDVAAGRAEVQLVVEHVATVNPALAPYGYRRRRGFVSFAQLAQDMDDVYGGHDRGYVTHMLCETPCTVNLPLGHHELRFVDVADRDGRLGTGFVNVGPTPSMVRHAMGIHRSYPYEMIGATLLITLGSTASLVGGMLELPNNGQSVEGWAVVGVGLSTAVIGIIMAVRSGPLIQRGSTTQWAADAPR